MGRIALIVGGSNGIGAALCVGLLSEYNYEKVYILDRHEPMPSLKSDKIFFHRHNLLNDSISVLNEFCDIDTLIITAGFGRVARFESITDAEIVNSYKVNSIAPSRILKRFWSSLVGKTEFYACVIGSIAGIVSSPLFSVYGASKAAVCKLTESLNIELEKQCTANRILNVSPGSIKGTRFHGGENDLNLLGKLASDIIRKMRERQTLFIPGYEEIYKDVIARYEEDPHEFGLQSFGYKTSQRINSTLQIKTGYLSGTFDLFHIGHLNLIKRAKDYCDHLVVGVHTDATHKRKQTFIPFEERCEIVGSLKYVDQVIRSCPEDIDVYKKLKYDYLFVGSDYKDSERFKRYEDFFSGKNVQIIYFPYTSGTSSSKLRDIIDSKISKELE